MDPISNGAPPPEMSPSHLTFLGVKNMYKIQPVTNVWCGISGLMSFTLNAMLSRKWDSNNPQRAVALGFNYQLGLLRKQCLLMRVPWVLYLTFTVVTMTRLAGRHGKATCDCTGGQSQASMTDWHAFSTLTPWLLSRSENQTASAVTLKTK